MKERERETPKDKGKGEPIEHIGENNQVISSCLHTSQGEDGWVEQGGK